jgi:hypothetical protein
MQASVRLKYVYRSRDRQRRHRWLLRIPGRKAVTLHGEYGSPAFMAAYEKAISEIPLHDGRRYPSTSLGAMVQIYFRDQRFTLLAETTQHAIRCYLERLAEEHGHRSLAGFNADVIKVLMLAKPTPYGRRNFLRAVRAMCSVAVEIG